MLKIFPVRLRGFRKEYGYTLRDVAKLLGVSVATVSSYERGTRLPTLEGLVQLTQLYHCSSDYLLGLDMEESNEEDVVIKLNALKHRLTELEQIINA